MYKAYFSYGTPHRNAFVGCQSQSLIEVTSSRSSEWAVSACQFSHWTNFLKYQIVVFASKFSKVSMWIYKYVEMHIFIIVHSNLLSHLCGIPNVSREKTENYLTAKLEVSFS